MMPALIGPLGWPELLILSVLGCMLVAPVIAVLVVVFCLTRRK